MYKHRQLILNGPPLKTNVKPRSVCMYLRQFDSCQHCGGQCCANTQCDSYDTKREGVVFLDTFPDAN